MCSYKCNTSNFSTVYTIVIVIYVNVNLIHTVANAVAVRQGHFLPNRHPPPLVLSTFYFLFSFGMLCYFMSLQHNTEIAWSVENVSVHHCLLAAVCGCHSLQFVCLSRQFSAFNLKQQFNEQSLIVADYFAEMLKKYLYN